MKYEMARLPVRLLLRDVRFPRDGGTPCAGRKLEQPVTGGMIAAGPASPILSSRVNRRS